MSEKEKDEKTELEEKEKLEKKEETSKQEIEKVDETEKEKSDEEVTDEVKKENNEEKEPESEETSEVEQLEDEDFENEKARIKAEKQAAKLAKKQAKQVYDAEGNPIEKKKMKKKTKIIILVCILAVILIIGGSIAYFFINPNNEQNFISDFMIESLINDYAVYINNGEWENADNCVDPNGFTAFYLIYVEDYYEDYINEISSYYGYDGIEIENKLSYMDFDKILADLETYCNKVEEDFSEYFDMDGIYEDLMEYVDYKDTGDIVSAYEIWADSNYAISNIEIDNIKNITKVEGTESLYKVTVVYSFTGSDSITENLYVSRVDGHYKIVGGDYALGLIQFNAYYCGMYDSTDSE